MEGFFSGQTKPCRGKPTGLVGGSAVWKTRMLITALQRPPTKVDWRGPLDPLRNVATQHR